MGRIVVDPALAPGLGRHDLGSSLTGTLGTEYGLKVVRKRVDMRPCALTTSVAEILDAKPGTPGLLVVRISFNADERVIEYDHEYWRHDAIRVLVDLDKRS
ncbi:UTRA domain-containing protein [Sphingomonas endophytica]|uniref:UTRA domain-containing protein n=1 Tax=Sphingomonas endophytica TaxID=869719 RepID=UPI001F4C8261|nr:UTRA domain-containing protein [Sphingomonas endophytica]